MYGILVVEDGNELYQILGEVASLNEAEELARGYEERCDPENPETFCPPSQFVVWRRDSSGAYVVRESLTPSDTTMARLDHIEKLCRVIPCNSAIRQGVSHG